MAASDNLNVQQFPIDKVGKMEAYNYPGETVDYWEKNIHGGSHNAEQRDLDSSVAESGVHTPGLTDPTGTILLEGHHRYRASIRAGKETMPMKVDHGFDMAKFRKAHGSFPDES